MGSTKMFRGLVVANLVIFCSAALINRSSDDTSDIASRIKHNLDTTENPCDNFYRFVCGNSNISNIAEKAAYDEDPVHKRVNDLIQRGTGSKDFKPFRLIDDVYKTCMSDEATGEQVVKGLSDLFYSLGGWPLLEGYDWRTLDYSWIDFVLHGKWMGLSVNPFLGIDGVLYPENDTLTTKISIIIDPPEFTRPITNSSDPLLIAYTSYIKKACRLIGWQITYSNEIEGIVEFERAMSEARLRVGKGYVLQEMTYKELTQKYPSVFWFKLIKYITNSPNEQLEPSKMSYFVTPNLGDIIDLLDRTDPRVLSNYACWKVLQQAIPYLTEDYRELKREYCLTQECEEIPRANYCYEVVKSYLAPAVNLLYAKRYFNKEMDAYVSDMVANVKNQMKNLINKSTWMDQDTKKKSIDIIDGTSVFIGYAEKNRTDDEFVKYFKHLRIDTSNFFQTLLNLEAFDAQRRLNSSNTLGLRNLVNPVEAFGPSYSTGRIDIPMAILQKPLFSIDYPVSINYGITGNAIAAEFFKEIVYLQLEQSKQPQMENLACFQKQFDNITSKEKISYQTSHFISEQLAYRASYQAFLSSNSDKSQSELPFTNNQMFWISSLQNLCARFPKEAETIDNKYDPFEFRTMKIVTSVPEFYDDFHCQSKPFEKEYGPPCSYL